MSRRTITREDILPIAEYAAIRREKAEEIKRLKRDRRLEVGPHATFYFENYMTLWRQIHEMLYIERGGEEQIADELAAYNPLIPQGQELVTTLMFEIDDRIRRQRVLGALGGVEQTISLCVGEERIRAVAEHDVARSDAHGKASAVHFLHFPFTAAQIRAFCVSGVQVTLGISHPSYTHETLLPERVRQALARDFDEGVG